MSDGRVQRMHLRGTVGHRIGDDIRLRLHRGREVEHPVGFERVDANSGEPPAIAAVLGEVRKQRARFVAQRRWREVFEIDNEGVGAAG
jgi:hypothetical protein